MASSARRPPCFLLAVWAPSSRQHSCAGSCGPKTRGPVTTPDATVAQAYDAIAAEYDGQLARDPIARYMRARLHEHLSHLFRPGDRVLDFTAGTGIDACYLASQGVRVMALDCSSGMIAQL